MSPQHVLSARHIASPLPRTGPSSGSSAFSLTASAPARRAMSAVPSAESASTTSAWSIMPRSRRAASVSAIGPIVAAHSRAGTTTLIRSRREDSAWSGKWLWWNVRTAADTDLVSVQMAVVREIPPWDALLAAGREDGRLVEQSALHGRPPVVAGLPEDLHPDVVRS